MSDQNRSENGDFSQQRQYLDRYEDKLAPRAIDLELRMVRLHCLLYILLFLWPSARLVFEYIIG